MDIQFVSRELTAGMIEARYPAGLFPMANPGSDVITWHRPRRRAVIPLDAFHISRSLDRTLRQARFRVSYDESFDAVMRACAERPAPESTWIDDRILAAYAELHRRGKAHSVEVWVDGALAGGVYGVHLGGAFFAESKFHRVRDMSKVALAHLVFRLRERGFSLLEVQYLTDHLKQFGTREIPHREYLRRLQLALAVPCSFP
jgi:leucyl/phenylalanyl-tRNA--protein transferase